MSSNLIEGVELIKQIVGYILVGGSAFINMVYWYNIIISLFAFKKKKYVDNYTSGNKKYFGILIACHNEEECIEDNLQAIVNSDYDKRYYSINIAIDNCTDETRKKCIEFASRNNCNINVVKVSGGSKPKAINTMIKELKLRGEWNKFDGIVFLDADNKCSPTMLSAFNYYYSVENEKVLQVRIKSDNYDTITSKGFKASFNNMHYSFHIARNNVGLSSSLCGTGFMCDKEVFEEVGFQNCNSLTEDLEFSVKAILKGYKVKYIPNEYVLNQNLDEFIPSVHQRHRWNKGAEQVSRMLSKEVFKKFIKTRKLQYLDTFIFITSPSRSLLCILISLLSFIYIVNGHYMIGAINLLSVIYQVVYCIVTNKSIKYLIPQMLYTATMFIILPWSKFTHKNTKWVKTKHKKISN